MKPLIITTAILAAIPVANATTVLTNYNLNTFLIANGGSRNFTVDDGGGNTVTFNITATLAAGQTFTNLDLNTHIGVDTTPVGGSGEQNHWSNTEDVTFTVTYVSSSPNVTISSVGFNFGAIGYRPITAGPTLGWAVNGGTQAIIPTSGGGDASYNLDTAGVFTSLSSPYIGVLETSSTANGQLSAVPVGGGMSFSLSYDVVPEPSVALLGGLGLLGLLRRRRI